jgi:hypothetical protein
MAASLHVAVRLEPDGIAIEDDVLVTVAPVAKGGRGELDEMQIVSPPHRADDLDVRSEQRIAIKPVEQRGRDDGGSDSYVDYSFGGSALSAFGSNS